eukprot:gnl/Chilomastix_cuspidata/1526.p1 GENE.gnl/Chilomastix_cuspidata/1526~~gnl/Chilomastix_cuspidata/1526.p1  ORF type:complete len:1344 (-),score=437.87 gnl/Chilomastix_cuspidata/1526:724-4755(-)
MSLFLNRLRISGVRSYSPDEFQEIKFDKPLTIILGKNGSGKTTIIESLRYVVADALPPGTSQGQKFVFDHSLRHGTTVDASVELELELDGQSVAIQRCMRVSKKARAKNFSFERLASTVVRGKRSSTHKSRDYIQELAGMLPVPVPVLENVVFCHQDEAQWIFGSDKEVKSKFDQIFAVARYQNALDVLDKQRKEAMARRREAEKMVIERAKAREMYEDHTKAYSKAAKQLVTAQKAQDDMQGRLERRKKRLQIAKDEEEKFVQLKGQCAAVKERLKIEMQEEATERVKLQSLMTEDIAIPPSAGALDVHQFRVSSLTSDIQEHERAAQEAAAQAREQVDRHKQSQREACRIMDAVKKRLDKLDAAVHAECGPNTLLTSRASLSGLDGEGDMTPLLKDFAAAEEKNQANRQKALEQAIQSAAERKTRIGAEADESERALARTKEESEAQAAADREFVNKKLTESLTISSKLASEEQELEKIRQRLREAEGTPAAAQEIEGQVSAIRSKLERTKETKHALEGLMEKTRASISEAKKKLSDLKAQLGAARTYWEAREELERMESKIASLQGPASAINQFTSAIAAAPINKALREFAATMQNHQISSAPPPSSDEKPATVAKCGAALSEALSCIAQCEMAAGSALRQAQTDERMITDRTRRASATASEHRRRLEAQMRTLDEDARNEVESFADLDAAETAKGERSEKLSVAKALQGAWSTLLTRGCKAHSCPVCTRGFSCEADEERFQRELKLKSSGSEIAEAEVALAVAQAAIHKLSAEQAESEVQKLAAELSTKEKSSADIARALKDVAALKHNLVQIQRTQKAAEAASADLNSLQERRARLTQRLAEVSVSDSLESYTAQIQQAQASLERSKEAKRSTRRDLVCCDEEKDSLILKESALSRKLLELSNLRNDLPALRGMEQEHSSHIEVLAAGKVRSEEELQKAQRIQKENEAANAEKLSALAEKSAELSEQLQGVTRCLAKLNGLHEKTKNRGARIQALIAEATGAAAGSEDARGKIAALKRHLNELTEKLSNAKTKKASLEATIEVIKVKAKLDECSSKVRLTRDRQYALEEQLKKGEASKVDELQTDVTKLSEMMSSSRTDVQHFTKQMQENDRARKKLQDAVLRHRKANLRVSLEKQFIKDIQLLSQALDAALVELHQNFILEVNSVLRSLWPRVYTGSDIAHIKLKSEPVSSSRTRRNYTYHLLMVKRIGTKLVELPMRSQSSAGQKVLASILIRLALSQLFGHSCPILALDEPTTNLDKKNAEALARALSNLLSISDATDRRASFPNFQLILITHDKNFIEHLQPQNFGQNYVWAVSKAETGQFSQITRKSIAGFDM